MRIILFSVSFVVNAFARFAVAAKQVMIIVSDLCHVFT